MKKFNFSKGLVIGLLTLALVLTGFGTVKASAAKGDEHTITFQAKLGDVIKGTYEFSYKEGAVAVTAGWYKSGASAPVDGLTITKAGWTPKDGDKVTIVYTAAHDDVAASWTANGYTIGGANATNVGEANTEVTYKAAVTAQTSTPQEITLAKVLEELGKVDECLYLESATAPTLSASDKGIAYDSTNKKFTITNDAQGGITVTVPVKFPKVTFNVTVTDMLHESSEDGYEGGDYTYVADASLQKKNASITDAALLEAITTGATPKNLSDPTAWVVISVATAANEEYTYSNGKLTLGKNLADDLTIAVTVANSKVPVRFTYTGGYTATILVDNKKGDYKIPFMDIVDALKKTVGNEEKTYAEVNSEETATKGITEYIILAAGLTGDNVTTTGKYSAWNYKYTVPAGLVGTKPNAVTIVAEKIVRAFDSAGYDPETDSIKFVSPVNLDVYWTDCKKAAGVSVKGDKLSTLSLAEYKTTDANDPLKDKFVGYISLTDKSAGVKIAESKTAYIYASFKAPAAEKTAYKGNYIVEATPYKKISVTFGYAQAEKDKTGPAIGSITTIDTKKKTVLYTGLWDEEKNPDNWLVKMSGTPVVTEYSKIFLALQYSTDGTTWYKILGNPLVKEKQVNDLNLGKLYDLVNGGSKTTLYFRIKGAAATVDNPSTTDEDETANAYRASKPVKINVDAAKAGKAVKVDVSKGTIALKNGYDFTMTATDKGIPALTNENGVALAYTILPFNKVGTATEKDAEGNDVVADTIATANFVPAAKVTENSTMFTKTKVKSYSIEKIVRMSGQSQSISISGSKSLYIWVRKSATSKKPAEQWTLVTVSQMTAAPTIANAKGATYYIAQDVEDTKGVVLTPEVKNASSDKNSGAFEYLIVDAADIVLGQDSKYHADIDLTSAKWTTLNDKGLTVGKSKSKYAKEEGKKASDHVLKDGSAVLVRRAGDKTSNILASDYLVTMIAKADVEIEVEKDGKKEKETKSLFVWKAYSAD